MLQLRQVPAAPLDRTIPAMIRKAICGAPAATPPEKRDLIDVQPLREYNFRTAQSSEGVILAKIDARCAAPAASHRPCRGTGAGKAAIRRYFG